VQPPGCVFAQPAPGCSNPTPARRSNSSSITRLTEGASVSRQAVTKHLHALARAGLVRSRRSGRERIRELRTRRLAEVRRHLDRISRQWDDALGRLRAFVEGDNR